MSNVDIRRFVFQVIVLMFSPNPIILPVHTIREMRLHGISSGSRWYTSSSVKEKGRAVTNPAFFTV